MYANKKTVLVVEDNLINREILIEFLKEEYLILEAENGQEALEIIEKRREEISIILLDINMPVMDGYTLLKVLKKDPELSFIPVIIMTQKDSEADEIEALTYGATDFISKPFKPKVIMRRIANIITLRETAALINQLRYDHMTGLYNKEYFYKVAQDLIDSNTDKKYAIIGSNIENFKMYNETYGSQEGDKLLCQVAMYLKNTFGKTGLCGRISGDRFVCIVEQEENYSEEDFRNINRELNEKIHTDNVNFIWGVYEDNNSGESVNQMCDRVKLAIDSIKGQYGKHYCIYDESLMEKIIKEKNITDIMEESLENGDFEVYLQPKHILRDERIGGAEALVRWTHPQYGFMSPAEFIPVFEKSGFIVELDKYMWDKCCSILKEWKENNISLVPISVNVSRLDILRLDLPQVFKELVEKYQVEPKYIHIEITESLYADNLENIASTIVKLRKMGFIVEMDDFGSGYSSLGVLGQIEVDVLKLDVDFVQNETKKPIHKSVLKHVIGMAREMNMVVVAEGVETLEQVEWLRRIGCDYAQGYYYSKAIPHKSFNELLMNMSQAVDKDAPIDSSPVQETKYFLLADEEKNCRELSRIAFSDKYIILEAENKDEAKELIKEHRREISAAMISMDLPGGDTNELIQFFREETGPWRVPIIGSTSSKVDLMEFEIDADVEDCTYKPRDERCVPCLKKRLSWLQTMYDIEEKERILKTEAHIDYQTQLLNRRGLSLEMDKIAARDYPMAVYMFDLDDLKPVNDDFGHETGDYMISFFGNELRTNTRPGDMLCRYGGDEFVAILKGVKSEEIALKIGNELCNLMKKCKLPGDFNATCSCGVALAKDSSIALKTIIKQADEAMYEAKVKNRGKCCLYSK